MRTHKIGATTIEYPDEISFCFNPVVINVFGQLWAWVEVSVTDTYSRTVRSEKRAMFETACFFDISFYMQSAFDQQDFNKVEYATVGAHDSNLGRLFSVEVDFYNSNGSLGNTFQFNTFVVWGAMKVGERYNGDRTLTWFKNYPFSVGIYSSASSSLLVSADKIVKPDIQLSGQKVWNVILKGIEANESILLKLPASDGASVFDNTFDFTFKGLTNMPSSIKVIVDDSKCGVYLRWINRHGFYCYWLFKSGDESRQIANDGEFIRNNMQDYSYKNGYHGGTGRKQRKTEDNTLPVCAPLVDHDTYDFLFDIAISPVVDLYAGKDSDGNDRWKAVNVSVGTFNKTNQSLQDFIMTIILPETRVQSL